MNVNLDHNYSLTTKSNLGKRMAAGFIDYSLIILYFLLIVLIFGEPDDEGGYSATGFPAFSIMIFWFVITIGIEQAAGATLGNQIFHLKPIPLSNTRKTLSFSQSLKRHLLDPIDFQLFGLVGAITMRNTRLNQRVGDLWANTVVIDIKDPTQGISQEEEH